MDRFKGLEIGLQSFTLRAFDVAGVVERIGQLGLKYVEFCKKHISPDEPEQTALAQELCAKSGITMNAYGVSPFGTDSDANRAMFEYAKKLGVGVITANPKPESFDDLDTLVEEYKIKIAIHNHGPKSLWPDIETIEAGIKDHSPLIGLCVDTGHFLRVPVDPIAVLNHFTDRCHSIHLKDIDEDKGDVHGEEHIIGDGSLDLAAVVHLLQEWDFAGPIALEYEINPEDPMDDLKIALDRIEANLK